MWARDSAQGHAPRITTRVVTGLEPALARLLSGQLHLSQVLSPDYRGAAKQAGRENGAQRSLPPGEFCCYIRVSRGAPARRLSGQGAKASSSAASAGQPPAEQLSPASALTSKPSPGFAAGSRPSPGSAVLAEAASTAAPAAPDERVAPREARLALRAVSHDSPLLCHQAT